MKVHFITLCITAIILSCIVLWIVKTRRIEDLNTGICIYQMNGNFSNINLSENITSPFKEIVAQYGWGKALSFNYGNLIVFNDYTDMDEKLSSLPFHKNKKYYINGMSGLDQLCSKSQMAIWLKRNKYDDIIPKTYCLDSPHDISVLEKNNYYILKKNIQRQTGLKITNDYSWIINDAKKEEYVVAQELLLNPYLISGRKINIRVYMAVIRRNNEMKFYIYSDGFIYYTKDKYDPDNYELDTNITTGYIDREVYEKNPLTTRDFMKYLGWEQAWILLTNMYKLFQQIKKTFLPVLYSKNRNIPGLLFNVFGVDIAPDNNLDITLIEINKGVSLVYMDERDKAVKYNMIRDLLGLVGIVHDSDPNNFIEIK